ncbi:uncharacterized protein LOC144605155 [Rhinoraja longicauda]
MGLQRWIGFMVLVEMVWHVSGTGTGPIARDWGEEANLPGWNARVPRQGNDKRLPGCTNKPDSDSDQTFTVRYHVVVASPGGSFMLYCKISEDYGQVSSVSWRKDGVPIAEYNDKTFAHYQGSDVHWRFVHQNVHLNRDASLLLTRTQENDGAVYSCVWTTSSQGKCEVETSLLME